MTHSALSQPAKLFGFPQVSNFDTLVMTAGTRHVKGKGAFWFSAEGIEKADIVRSSPDVTFVGIYFGIDSDEILKQAADNLEQAVAYIPNDPDDFAKYFSSSNHTYSNKAKIIVPVTASMTKDDMHNVESNLWNARFWYLLSTPQGMVDERTKEQSEQEIEADPALKAYRGLLSGMSGADSELKLTEMKAKLFARRQAKEFLAAAYEIYTGCNPPIPTTRNTRAWRPVIASLEAKAA